jgi:hypothetical protein
MGYKLNVSKIKANPPNELVATQQDCGTLGFPRVTVSLPKLVQQSRAIYRTASAKVKTQKEKRALVSLGSPLANF